MKVKMTSQISGLRNGKEWPAAGGVIDLPDDEAQVVIAGGHGVESDGEVDDLADEKPEDDRPPVETATAKSDAETR